MKLTRKKKRLFSWLIVISSLALLLGTVLPYLAYISL
jgi:hypothetical protein